MAVLINLLWHSLVGVDMGRTLSQLLGQQSWLVQVVLIVTTVVVFGAIVYQIVLALPELCTKVIYHRQIRKHKQAQRLQQQLQSLHTEAVFTANNWRMHQNRRAINTAKNF
jgi:hypothetical protein